jgi:Hypothetical glycosyl hydrolase family 15
VDAPRLRRVLAAAVVAAFALSGANQVAPAAAATPQPGIGALRICTDCARTGGDLSRYRYVILNSWDAPLLPALRAQNPGLKALVYKNLTFTVSYGCSGGVDLPHQTAGVGYCDANANHPDWFLTDQAGNRLNSSGFSQAWMMDVGNAAYQDRWLANVKADVQAGGWDGVFMDDTDASMDWHLNGRTIARYPTAAAWRAATRSMLARVGPALTSAGVLAVPNLYAPWGSDYDAQATWSDWIQFTSGAAQEFYSKWGTASSAWFASSDWTFRQQFQAITEQAGKIFLGITYAPQSDTHSMAWARANFLLFDDPAADGALIYEFSDPEAQDPYSGAWTADIGSPLGARFQVGVAWRRNFSGGTVVVNPTSSTVTVALGQPYLTDSGVSASSLTLGPTSGAILRSAGVQQLLPALPSPPVSAIALSASASGSSVQLSWSGLKAGRADVFRNGARVATVANSGSYADRRARRDKGTFTYKVCAAGTSTCSQGVSVKVDPNSRSSASHSLTAFLVPALKTTFLERHRSLLRRHATRAHHSLRRTRIIRR